MSTFKKLMLSLVLSGVSFAVSAEDVVGTLTPKPEGAAADVTAVLHVKKKGEEKKYNLVATGDTAKSIEEMVKGSKKVKVSGEISGETIKVTSVGEAPEKKKKDK